VVAKLPAGGVNKALCAPGQKHFCAPTNKKVQIFKLIYRRKSAEKSKAEHLLFVTSVIFRSNAKFSNARNALDKAISVGRSNNTGSRD